MKKCLETDLFDGTRDAPAAQPLKKRAREKFCQLLSGEHSQSQTDAYMAAFGIEKREVARAAASRLMRDPEVRARLNHLRNDAIASLGTDRLWLLQKRIYLAENARNPETRLRALEHIERSLGLDAPIKIDLSGQLDHTHTGAIIHIHDPLALARAAEALRANRSEAHP